MKTFLLWNICGQPIVSSISRIVKQNDVDVVFLLESSLHPANLLTELNTSSTVYYEYSTSPLNACKKIQIFSRIEARYFIPMDEDHRTTTRRIIFSEYDLLIVVYHGVDKKNFDDDSQSWELAELSRFIQSVEKQVGHQRTILVGDLNVDPFENGVISTGGLHGVMSREIAKKQSRIVQEKQYPFFYNPMWSLYSNGLSKPPATFYYPSSKHKAFFWHMFDQVLIRPDLLDFFIDNELKIIDNDGFESLLNTNKIPDKNKFSDHLPILFKLDL